MKKFDFRRQLKDMDIDSLKKLESVHMDYMLGFIGFNDKESAKHFRYLGYIQERIKKLQNTNSNK